MRQDAMSGLARHVDAELAQVVENLRGSLVQIGTAGRNGAGGTIWHPDGLILSNAHVAERGPLTVTLADGRTLSARVLATDGDADVAALSVNAEGLPAIPLGESSRLRPGQLVLALGHPWGTVGAASIGMVIGMGQGWPQLPQSGRDWIVTNINLRPGNSGGPLVDVRGRLVGINSMVTGPKVRVAVPVHVVKAFLKQALEAVPAAS